MATVWQIACGETGRRYDDLFRRHDVMFCGPGRYGPFDDDRYSQVIISGEFSASKIGQVRQFSQRVQPGDHVLMRLGREVVGIGIVADAGYQHLPIFDDIYGWDLDHAHRVVWQPQFAKELKKLQAVSPLFAGSKQMPTFTAVNDERVLGPLRHMLNGCQERELAELPSPPSASLSLDDLGLALFRHGLGNEAVSRVQDAIQKQRRLIEWYRLSGMAADRPTEHEVVAHIILPLMLALGWSEQLLAVEWNRIDLGVFRGTPTDRQSCGMVCEAKGMGHALQDVFLQATGYVERLDLRACNRILVTDGQQFFVYHRANGEWPDQPAGYFNVLKLRERCVCPADTNAVETLMSLTPARIAQQ